MNLRLCPFRIECFAFVTTRNSHSFCQTRWGIPCTEEHLRSPRSLRQRPPAMPAPPIFLSKLRRRKSLRHRTSWSTKTRSATTTSSPRPIRGWQDAKARRHVLALRRVGLRHEFLQHRLVEGHEQEHPCGSLRISVYRHFIYRLSPSGADSCQGYTEIYGFSAARSDSTSCPTARRSPGVR